MHQRRNHHSLWRPALFWLGISLMLLACNLISFQNGPVSTLTPETNVTEVLPTDETKPIEDQDVTEGATLAPEPEPQATIPDPDSYFWEVYADGFDRPVDLSHAGDGTGRIFVVEQAGLIWIVIDGSKLPIAFLDIRARVGDDENEQGLLGLAFHPQYAHNGFFYVNYSDTRGDTVFARFQVSEDADIANPDSEFIILQVGQPFGNHNGGGLAFGPDGFLYIGLGDGGLWDDPYGNGQDLNTHLGKLLRVDVDNGSPYSIPADNPFVDGGGLLEIWAYGLRNPWRFSFDSLTGDLFIADVGQNEWEEIDFLRSGSTGALNFGWDYWEGSHRFEGSPPSDVIMQGPVVDYDHGLGCSVTGGYVYRGQELPEWQGVYIYGDYCTGIIWGLVQDAEGVWQNSQMFQIQVLISSFGLDEAGELYLVGHEGSIYRLSGQ
ncbi:MAG: PQQ-dependent sugar dehydrogenase [Chloroflexi bacterium]|nr:PQQ-dependent sugar dehydrogenase [Chloroflexota bacterium]